MSDESKTAAVAASDAPASEDGTDAVAAFYGETTAAAYASTMDEEMKTYFADLDVFMADLVEGPVLDTSAGSGHMLQYLHEKMPERTLHGSDLSADMVAVAKKKCPSATITVGDMRDLSAWESGTVAGLISTFALHHVGEDDARKCLGEWGRVLKPGGRAYIALWEGSGSMDMPPLPDGRVINAFNYAFADVEKWLAAAGFKTVLSRTAKYEEFDANMAFFVVARDA